MSAEQTETEIKTETKIQKTVPQKIKRFIGVGKRKNAIARLYLLAGSGKITVNKRGFENYFPRETLRMMILQPMEATGNIGKFDVFVNVQGGGLSGQAGAVRHGISRALLSLNPDYRKPLNKGKFLTRDARKVERKKYGHRKARKVSQYSKR